MKLIRVWVPLDQERWGPPRVIACDATSGPHPGKVYEVLAPTGKRAKDMLRIALGSAEPDRRSDPSGWAEWLQAREDMREVTSA